MNAFADRAARYRRRLRRHYDALGARQDAEAWYEDPALDDLCAAGGFEDAFNVVEIGCGTGRFADRLLSDHLPGNAAYLGIDVSPVMAQLTRDRLARFGDRCRVETADAVAGLPLPECSADRVVAVFVLDLMTIEDIHKLMSEVRRILAPGGLFCAASLASGQTFAQGIRAMGWRIVQWFSPLRVGGCRPLSLPDILQEDWSIQNYMQRNIKNCAVASICASTFPDR